MNLQTYRSQNGYLGVDTDLGYREPSGILSMLLRALHSCYMGEHKHKSSLSCMLKVCVIYCMYVIL